MKLVDPSKVGPKDSFRSYGAISVVNYGKENMQLVIGTRVQMVLQDVKDQMSQ